MPQAVPSTKVIIDACSLINLVNGNVLDIVLALPHHFYCLGSIVLSEAESAASQVEDQIAEGKLVCLDPSEISAQLYLQNLYQFELGQGETECITYALTGNYCVCTDDMKARKVVQQLIGKKRLTGTPALMIEAVKLRLLTPQAANDAYALMIAKGGFLPALNFFNIDI
jgi:predicted nucleic acid-binding protein